MAKSVERRSGGWKITKYCCDYCGKERTYIDDDKKQSYLDRAKQIRSAYRIRDKIIEEFFRFDFCGERCFQKFMDEHGSDYEYIREHGCAIFSCFSCVYGYENRCLEFLEKRGGCSVCRDYWDYYDLGMPKPEHDKMRADMDVRNRASGDDIKIKKIVDKKIKKELRRDQKYKETRKKQEELDNE